MLRRLFGPKSSLNLPVTKAQTQPSQVQLAEKINKKGYSALHKAILKGNVSFALSLLESAETDVNCKDDDGNTPLHYAVNRDDTVLASKLLEKGARINSQNEKGETPLHLAIGLGKNQTAIWLLEQGANAKLQTTKDVSMGGRFSLNNTPLHIAFFQKELSEPLLKALLTAAPFVNQPNNKGLTQLELAFMHPQFPSLSTDLIDQFFKCAAFPIRPGYYHMFLQLAADNPKMTEAIYERLLKMYMVIPCKQNLVDIADEKGRTPLVFAAQRGNLAVIQSLSRAGAQFNGHAGELAIKKAILNGHVDAVIALIENGASPNVHIYKSRHSDKFTLSSSSSYSVDERDGKDSTGLIQDGDTPLHFAVKIGHQGLAAACLKADPSMVNAVNDKGKSPAFTAIKMLNPFMAHLLVKANADIHEVQKVPGTESRFVTLEMEAARRGFKSKEDMHAFFGNPEYKLSEEQQAILASTNKARLPVSYAISKVGILKSPSVVSAVVVEEPVAEFALK